MCVCHSGWWITSCFPWEPCRRVTPSRRSARRSEHTSRLEQTLSVILRTCVYRGVFRLVWLEKDAENFLQKTKKKTCFWEVVTIFQVGLLLVFTLGGFATFVSLGYFLKLLTFNFAVAVFFFKNFPIHISQFQAVTHTQSQKTWKNKYNNETNLRDTSGSCIWSKQFLAQVVKPGSFGSSANQRCIKQNHTRHCMNKTLLKHSPCAQKYNTHLRLYIKLSVY